MKHFLSIADLSSEDVEDLFRLDDLRSGLEQNRILLQALAA